MARLTLGGDGSSFKLSEEGEAFLEAACGSQLDYKSRKPKMANTAYRIQSGPYVPHFHQ